MTREQVTDHYIDVVMAVFKAENAVMERVKPILKDIDYLAYCKAVAEEIVSKTSDEELEELYG